MTYTPDVIVYIVVGIVIGILPSIATFIQSIRIKRGLKVIHDLSNSRLTDALSQISLLRQEVGKLTSENNRLENK